MSRQNPVKLALLMAVLALLTPLAVLVRGGLPITQYDGDALHLADIVLRMAAGARPHEDFMTPLGALAFAPVALFADAGAKLGLAFALGQALFAAGAGLGVLRAGWSRLRWPLALGFVAVSGVLLNSLTHGAEGMIAVSMHYNRWAWVLAFCAVLLAVLPDRHRPRPVLDGAVLGALAAGLMLLKITYLVAFAPALVLILILRGEMRMLLSALLSGAVLGGLLLILLGPDFWLAYLGDLREVAESGTRSAPGLALADLVVSPAYFPGAAAALAGAALLRRSGQGTGGLALILLFPAFIYVTWQNFGNDPWWLAILAVLLFEMRPERRHAMHRPVNVAALAAMILVAPLVLNHALSVPRLLVLPTGSHVPLVPGAAQVADITMPRLPAALVRGRVKLNEPGAMFDAVPDPQEQGPLVFAGEILAECQAQTGIPAVLEATAAGVGGGRVLVADIVGAQWLYAGAPPVPGSAPWNYGTLAGIAAATHVLVPLCPVSVAVRRAVLEKLEGQAVALERREAAFLLFRLAR